MAEAAHETGAERAALWLSRLCGSLFVALAVLWTFQVPSEFGIALFREQYLVVCLGLAGAAVFLTVRFDGSRGPAPPIDWIAALLMLAVPFYIAWHYERMLGDAPLRTTEMLVLGTILVVLVLEGLRRVAGHFLFFVVLVFLAYGLVAHFVPPPLTGTRTEIVPLIVYLGFDTNALLGAPLAVATTIVVLFIFLGRVLFKTGGGEFFTDIAMATMGRRRGGAAKIAVAASAMFGSISGSAISNVSTTGVVTIPLMTKTGYSPVDAGAIESNASTGGQFMPPIMGAAAFLMAEFVEISYASVVAAALIPALLYYFAIFVQVDLVAARDRIKVITEQLPKPRSVLRQGWHFIAPFAVLIYALYGLRAEPEAAAMYAVATIVVLGVLRKYKTNRMNPRRLAESFWEAGIVTAELVMIVAAAGFVIGILNKTGGGFALTLFLVQLGGGQIFFLLAVAAVICIVLGMGMPTTGVYVLLAALVAPALVEAGIAKLAAHMFILYFGMMSMITPPIALAAFAAASISRASPMQTGFAAMRMGWVAYVIPFLFVLSPSLIMLGEPWKIALNVCTAAVGIYIVSAAVAGYFTRALGAGVRILLGIGGLMAVFPDTAIEAGGIVDAAGIVLGLGVLAREYLATRRKPEAASERVGA